MHMRAFIKPDTTAHMVLKRKEARTTVIEGVVFTKQPDGLYHSESLTTDQHAGLAKHQVVQTVMTGVAVPTAAQEAVGKPAETDPPADPTLEDPGESDETPPAVEEVTEETATEEAVTAPKPLKTVPRRR